MNQASIQLGGDRRVGILQVLLSGVCFGFLGLFGKAAYRAGLEPFEFLSLRFLIGSALLALFTSVQRPGALRLKPRELLNCAILGVFGYAVFSSCFFTALKGLSASLTVLLLYIYPVIVSAGAWILFGERIPRSRWVALPLAMTGLCLLIWGDMQVNEPRALVFGVGAAFLYSGYILASSRLLKHQDPLASVAFIQLAAGLAIGILTWRDPARIAEVVSAAWPTLLGVGLVGTAMAMSLFISGLKKLRNWEVSILSTAEPVTGIALAILFLGESLSLAQACGGAAVLVAFLVVAYPARAARAGST